MGGSSIFEIYLWHEDQSRHEHHLCKEHGVDPLLLVLLELDPRVLEEVHRVLGVHVLRQVELEVELPGGDPRVGQLTLLVQERHPQLDDLQQVDVATKQLVLVVGRRLELTWKHKRRS